MDVVSENVVFIGAGSPNEDFMHRTTDGGQSWETFALPSEGQGWSSFISAEVGYVRLFEGLYKTTNGGASWDFVSNPEVAFRMEFLNENVGFAFSYWVEIVAMTLDGGVTWEQQPITNPTVSERLGDSLYFLTLNSRIFQTSLTSILGVDEIVQDQEEGIVLFPNPSEGMVSLGFADELIGGQLQLFDPQGKMVENLIINDKLMTLDLSTYAKGVYVVQVSGDGLIKTGKLVLR